MGSNRLKNQSKHKQNILKDQSSKIDGLTKYNENFRVSFEYLDVTQGQNFKNWEEDKILSKMNETLLEYCKEPIYKKKGKNFKEYGEFPYKTEFKYPKNVDKDVNWGALHITGKHVLGGFIAGNTFFVVFLDKEHKFWVSEKKHT